MLPSVFYVCFFWYIGVTCGQQGVSFVSTPVKFSINSHRNLTGHWVTQVKVEHGAKSKQTGALDVDIEHTTKKYETSETILIIATITAPPQRPGRDYELVQDFGYYKLHTEPRNWHNAREKCVKEGGHIVVINSEKEFEAIRKIWDRYPTITDDWRNTYTFVGVSDLETTKKFITIFGEHINATGYTNWNPSQPNYDGHCVVVQRNGLLHDTKCDILFPFFCEQEL
ncbi:hemolymph lipopolysaccharide-binding protein-like [Periplaneta americana]|uniref:hemolymph lipopolysaccharide-binding protein-like n=1 Tax=Periplaneta americana TaxID=6978 RepID=UPI0037E7AEBA